MRGVLLGLGLVLLAGWAHGAPHACDPLPVLPSAEELASVQALGLDVGVDAVRAEEGDAGCQGRIRPGARLDFGSTYCTAGWVLRDAQGAMYLSTAGHCVPTLESTRVEIAGLGDIGDPVYTTGRGGVGNDFALIRIDPALHAFVDPTVCRWQGPSGLARGGGGGARGEAVLHYGWGHVYGAAHESRARVAWMPSFGWGDGSLSYVGATNGGDSGSPLMDVEGRALGLHTHTSGLGTAPGAGAGLKFGTRLDSALARAEGELGRGLALLASPEPARLAP